MTEHEKRWMQHLVFFLALITIGVWPFVEWALYMLPPFYIVQRMVRPDRNWLFMRRTSSTGAE